MSGSSFSNVCSWPRSWWYVVIPIDADSKSRAQVWKRTSLRWHGIAVCFEASSSSFPAIRVTACSTALASVQGSMRLLLTGPRYCNVLSTLLSLWPAFLHPLLPATVFVGCFGALPTSNAPLESLLKWKQGGTKTEELWFSDDFPSTHPLFQLKKWATVQNSCLILIPRPISKKYIRGARRTAPHPACWPCPQSHDSRHGIVAPLPKGELYLDIDGYCEFGKSLHRKLDSVILSRVIYTENYFTQVKCQSDL